MRLAVLADIHGNLPALEAVLDDVRQYEVDGFIVAGDHVDKGPYPNETLHLLRTLKGWLIRGNADDYFFDQVAHAPRMWPAGRKWAAVRWACQRLDEEALCFIGSLPEQCVVAMPGTAPIRVVHCSPHDPTKALFPSRDPIALAWYEQAQTLPPESERLDLDSVMEQLDEPLLICGDTHIPWHEECKNGSVVNPGAVSFSLNGDPRANYALLTWQDHHWQVEHRAVAYDLDRIRTAFQTSGFLEEGGGMARAFLLAIETGQNVPRQLLTHFHRLAADAGSRNGVAIPDEVWDQAVATFDWDAAINPR